MVKRGITVEEILTAVEVWCAQRRKDKRECVKYLRTLFQLSGEFNIVMLFSLLLFLFVDLRTVLFSSLKPDTVAKQITNRNTVSFMTDK